MQVGIRRWIRIAIAIALVAGCASLSTAQTEIGNHQAEVVNYETPLIRPLAVTADGDHLVAINEPDNRLSVWRLSDGARVAEIRGGLGMTALAERPGGAEIWVSAMHSSSVLVIDTATWRVTDALTPPSGTAVGWGDAAAPGGIAFSADGLKAYVTAQATNALVVWDAAAKTHLKTVPVAVSHNGPAQLKEPRDIVRSGDTIYVGVFRSGNGTVAGPASKLGIPPDVRRLDAFPNLSLPDVDIVGFSTLDESVVVAQKEVGNLIFDLEVHPDTGALLVTSLDALNADFMGEGAFPGGRMTLNGLTFVDPSEAPADYTRVVLEDLGPGADVHVAMPTGLAVDGQGRVFVAGYASDVIGIFDSSGAFLDTFSASGGPRALAVTPDGETIYSLNHMAGTISSWDVSDATPVLIDTFEVGAFIPTYRQWALGRKFWHDAANSGTGSTGCFSCHPDVQTDGLGWDLSGFQDAGEGQTPLDPPQFWRDQKMMMVTQDSRSIEASPPYHWRGEQKDLDGFNGAFVGLLKGASLSGPDFAAMQDYTFGAVYPANPFQGRNRVLTPEAANGLTLFTTRPEENKASCSECHKLPTGSGGHITSPFVSGFIQRADGQVRSSEPAHFRGIWTKTSPRVDVSSGPGVIELPVNGFGFDHGGGHLDADDFVDIQFPSRPDGERDELKAFLREFDSGLAPATMFLQRLAQDTLAGFDGALLSSQLTVKNCDAAAFGQLDLGSGPFDVGLAWNHGLGAFVADEASLGTFLLSDLEALATDGKADLLVLGVPVWSGERIGIDRDRDGLNDGDEVALGTDPANFDTDGDGFWDSYDDDPLTPGVSVLEDQAPVVSGLEVRFTTTNVAQLVWETDTFSPTRVVYGRTDQYGQEVGDPLVLPLGSNQWKRHHAIVLRNMDDGVDYHFQVQTQGQNGVVGGSGDSILTTQDDALPEIQTSIHVLDMTVAQSVGGGGQMVFTATVTVEDNKRVLTEGIEIHGIWTLFRDGDPLVQRQGDGGLTGIDGVGTVELVVNSNAILPGDVVEFNIPMTVGELGVDEIGGLIDPIDPLRPFSWPNNEVRTVQLTVQ